MKKTNRLQLSRDFSVPAELALQKNAILAVSGAGKSNTAVVLAEEMWDAGIPWVAIDPKGDWYGVRSMANGKEGLPVPILGGLHGDMPLDPNSGAELARFICEKRITCVLDVSEFDSKAEQMRFLTAFATELLRRLDAPLHIFAEEADEYIPQAPQREENKCLSAWKKLVKRIRFRGGGVTIISQRSAALHKDALNQVDNLIPMRVMAPRDKKAIKDWVSDYPGGPEIVKTLPMLEDGEAWVFSPQKLKIMERVKFRRRRTFDSGEAPSLDPTAKRRRVKLADINMEELRGLVTEDGGGYQDEGKASEKLRKELVTARAERDELKGTVALLESRIAGLIERARKATAVLDVSMEVPRPITMAVSAPAPRPKPRERPPAQPSDTTPREGLKGCPGALLGALLQHGRLDLTQAAIIAGYAPRSSTVDNAARKLRNSGLIVGGNTTGMEPTEKGRAARPNVSPLPTGPKLAEHWLNRLGGCPGEILRFLIGIYPSEASLHQAAEATGYSPRSSTVDNAARKIRKLKLITGNNSAMKANERLVK